MDRAVSRRRFLQAGTLGAAALWANIITGGCGAGKSVLSRQLAAADTNGVRLPPGFRSRIVARSGAIPVAGSAYPWHAAPDGGACFATADGGWIYVSNAEVDNAMGGAGALKFDASGGLVEAYPILTGTSRNCAGGATPWGTWLSCEETDSGQVWETDPLGQQPAIVRPVLGVFSHEAVAVDPTSGQLYLTEDKPDGGLYRFTPDVAGSLDSGVLDIASVSDGVVRWLPVPDPLAGTTPTRNQQPAGTAFNGGEGIVYHDGRIFFTTKGDNRVWALHTTTQAIDVIYDDDDAETPLLTGVDNLTVDGSGRLYVAEDGGDLQVVALGLDGSVFAVAQLEGHDASEIAGVAFDPSGTRLYFSSQRGTTGSSDSGTTFEITGPFMSL